MLTPPVLITDQHTLPGPMGKSPVIEYGPSITSYVYLPPFEMPLRPVGPYLTLDIRLGFRCT